MQQPESFNCCKLDKYKVLKLNKAIYGLKQASRAWNDQVNAVLLEIGYKRSNIEPCL